MTWLAFAVLTLLTVAVLVWPLVRRRAATFDALDADRAVYIAQLEELDRDVKDGLLSGNQAQTAKLEVQRRLLAVDRRAAKEQAADDAATRSFSIVGVAVVVPFAALAVYLSLGSPDMPGASVADRRANAMEHPDDADMNVLVEELADRMRQNPDSTEGWVLLARSYRQLGRLAETAAAYRRALAQGINDPLVFAEFGEVLVALNEGAVTPEARDVFRITLRENRDEPRARFYLGLAEAQDGDVRSAIAIWRDLTATSPADAPWTAMVREQMGEVAMSAGIMPMTVTPRHPLDPEGDTAAVDTPADLTTSRVVPQADEDDYRPDVSGLAGQFSNEQLTMIQEMVGGLEARMEFGEPDFEGWMQLGRSYTVLGNTAKAINAFRAAADMRPDAVLPRVQLADTLLREVGPTETIPEEVVTLSAEILALDSNNPDGLFISGLAAASTGNVETARQRWQLLLQILPPGDSARAAVERRLAELPG
jgi:cytochrome c-type biogenesis protein CcmH